MDIAITMNANTDVAKVIAERATLKTEKEYLEGVVKKLDDEISHLRVILSEGTTQVELVAIKEKLSNAMLELDASYDVISSLREQLESLSNEKLKADVKVMDLSAEISTLKEKKDKYARNAQDEELLKLMDELMQVQSELAEVTAENGRLRDRYSAVNVIV